MRDIVLYSGGPDSLITLHFVKNMFPEHEILPIYYDLGHRYARDEIRAVLKTFPNTRIETALLGLGTWEEADAFIWHRNAFLVLAAAKEIKTTKTRNQNDGVIWLSVQKDEMSIPDRDPVFFLQLSQLLLRLGQQIRIKTPWEELDKTEMVHWYLSNGGDESMLRKTWSCYRSSGGVPCGNCSACIRRFVAFSLNGVDEEYAENPLESTEGRKYLSRAKSRYYSEVRNARIIEAFREVD